MHRKRLLAGLVALALFAVGCGQSAKPAAPAPAASSQSSQPGAAKPTEPAKPKDLGKVKIVQSVETLSFAPMYIARAKNYFKEEGVDADVTVVAGGAEANAALVGKSAEFGAVDSGAVPQLAEKGVDILSIQANVANLTMNFVVRKEVAEKLGLKRDLPLKERFAKLKGMTIGITGPGAATDLYSRFYLKQAGLDPEKDAKLVGLGGGAALAAALKAGKIDAFQLSPPTPESLEADGSGIIVIAASRGDVPELKFPYEVLVTRQDFAKQKPEVVRAVARAVGRANNFILQNPDEAAKLIQPFFPSVKPDILAAAMKNIVPAVPKDGVHTKAGWENLSKIMLEAGLIKKAFDATEGKYWTNEYIKDLNGLADKK